MTVIEFIQSLLEKWPVTELPVSKDGKRTYQTLAQIEDQRLVLRYVEDKLKQYKGTLPKTAAPVPEV